MVCKEICDLVVTKSHGSHFILGIDGLGGSGKTTLAESIQHHLHKIGHHAIVLHIDDFIYPKNIRYDHTEEEWFCYYHVQWRYDYLIDEVLSPVKLNKEVYKSIEIYDKTNDTYQKQALHISKHTILIVEGVFLQRPPLKEFFNYFIYIDVPKNERLKRVIKRDTYIGDRKEIVEKYMNRYIPAEDKYIHDCDPVQHADYVVTYNK